MLTVLLMNPFSFWLYGSIICLILMFFSPNRYEFFNDMKNFFMQEGMDAMSAAFILYIVLPLSIFQVIKTYRKNV